MSKLVEAAVEFLARDTSTKQTKKDVKEGVQIKPSEFHAFRKGEKTAEQIASDKNKSVAVVRGELNLHADHWSRGENHYNKLFKVTKEEVSLDEEAHKVSVSVSDPNHPMVSKRDDKMEKRVIVNADNRDEAVVKAKEFYKKKGLKVHSAEYHSAQPKSSMK